MSVVIITGASRGIGRNIVERLVENSQWKRIYCISRTISSNSFKKSSCIVPISCDITKRGEIDECFQVIKDDLDKKTWEIGGLVHAAGSAPSKLLIRSSYEELNDFISGHLVGTCWILRKTIQEILRRNKAATASSLIVFGSIVGLDGNHGQVAYSAVKSGYQGMVKSIAKEYASRNIRANLLCPGFIDTSMTQNSISNSQKDKIISSTPMGRLGSSDDISPFVEYLLSGNSSFVTGQSIRIDGGLQL